ncbi:MAG: hypothetical protein LQ351_007799 [Letrouitia transgressa]|nr:MAG: hypothetical protein LQ351_007799 [Letrouitia transgressa]
MALAGLSTLDVDFPSPLQTARLIRDLQTTLAPRLPKYCSTLFAAKAAKHISFEQIGQAIGRDEVAVAAIFYGQAAPFGQEVLKLSSVLSIPFQQLESEIAGFPFRGQAMEMPPKEPLIYRLYEIVMNYGYAYKAVLNEKFGDGIMSAIAFSTKVEKEVDDQGNVWANIHLRGKW